MLVLPQLGWGFQPSGNKRDLTAAREHLHSADVGQGMCILTKKTYRCMKDGVYSLGDKMPEAFNRRKRLRSGGAKGEGRSQRLKGPKDSHKESRSQPAIGPG